MLISIFGCRSWTRRAAASTFLRNEAMVLMLSAPPAAVLANCCSPAAARRARSARPVTARPSALMAIGRPLRRNRGPQVILERADLHVLPPRASRAARRRRRRSSVGCRLLRIRQRISIGASVSNCAFTSVFFTRLQDGCVSGSCAASNRRRGSGHKRENGRRSWNHEEPSS